MGCTPSQPSYQQTSTNNTYKRVDTTSGVDMSRKTSNHDMNKDNDSNEVQKVNKKFENFVKKAIISMETIKSQQNERTPEGVLTEEFRKAVLSLLQILSFAIGCTSPIEKSFLLEKLTTYNIQHETIEIFCRTCTETLNDINSKDKSGLAVEQIKSLDTMLSYLVNGSDDTPEVCAIIADNAHFLQTLSTILVSWREPHFNETLQQSEVLDLIVTVLHNIAVFDDNVPKLRTANVIESLKPYLDSKDNTVRLLSLATLADLVNESESEILKSNGDAIEFLMWTISMATETDDRTWDGWSLKELARIVRQVARNDNNKRTVVLHGAVPLLIKLAGSDVIEEQRESVAAIWTLSFDKENRTDMLNNRDWRVMETLDKLSKSADEGVKKISKKALWTINDHEPKDQELSSKISGQKTDKADTHVMISYNWGHQSMVKQIRDNLRNNGIKVWMDVDDMQGSTLQAMASAVEKADIVLVCYSSKYKNSDNCRAEAEYAFQLKKKIIPVRMELNYTADGWLGFIMGAKLFYDFSGKYPFENKIKELIREIQENLKKQNVLVEVPDEPIIVQKQPILQTSMTAQSGLKPKEPQTNNIAMVRKWSADQVGKWLNNNDLSKKLSGRLRGKDVAFLHILLHESPDTFYRTIRDQLGVNDIQTMSDLRFALDDFDLDHEI